MFCLALTIQSFQLELSAVIKVVLNKSGFLESHVASYFWWELKFIRLSLCSNIVGLLFSRSTRVNRARHSKTMKKTSRAPRRCGAPYLSLGGSARTAIITALNAIPRTDFHLKSKKDKCRGWLEIIYPRSPADDQSGPRERERPLYLEKRSKRICWRSVRSCQGSRETSEWYTAL